MTSLVAPKELDKKTPSPALPEMRLHAPLPPQAWSVKPAVPPTVALLEATLMPCRALGMALVPALFVPMKLPCTLLPGTLRKIASLPLPEMTLRADGVVPPIVIGGTTPSAL